MNIHSAVKYGAKDVKSPQPAETSTTTPATPILDNAEKSEPSPISAVIKPLLKSVDLSIAGTPHRITCAVEDAPSLELAASFLNDKIRESRRDIKGKNPTNEELLVLVCLDLYDQVENLKSERKTQLLNNERAKTIIEKINKEARSIL